MTAHGDGSRASRAPSNQPDGADAQRTGRAQRTAARSILNAVLLIAIVSGWLFLWRGESPRNDAPPDAATPQRAAADASPPPPPQIVTDEAGMRVYRLGSDASRAWCQAHQLPDPPPVDTPERRIADSLTDALHAAARERTGAAFGRVGMICASLWSHRAAAAWLQRAAALDPHDYRWPYYLGIVHQRTGRDHAAVAAYESARKLSPDFPTTYARLGQLHLAAGRLDEAEQALRQYVARRPADSLGAALLGRAAYHRGRFKSAVEYLEQAAARPSYNNFLTHDYLSRAYAALGTDQKAAEHLAKSRALPRQAGLRFNDQLERKLNRAAGSAMPALEAEFKQLAGSTDWARLAGVAERMVAIRPTDTTMQANLAMYYQRLRRLDDAHRVLDRAQRYRPDSAMLHARRSSLYLTQRRPADALKATDAALTGTAADQVRFTALEVRARALLRLKRLDEAETAIRAALDTLPNRPTAVFVLGEILFAKGRTDEALAQYRKTLELKPDFAPAKRRLRSSKGGP
ncbi:MAG: tetratricopeptide repeat protein [Phycisphaerae bacterium]